MSARPLMRTTVLAIALGLGACAMPGTRPDGPIDSPTKGWPDIRDSAYRAIDRRTRAPADYGLYSVLLTRSANRNAVRLLTELFKTTGASADAAIPRANLNLVMLPVKDAGEATRAMAAAREQPEATAAAVLGKHYDFGQAALLLASVCQPSRGAAVMKVCGSAAPDGPILVTSQQPALDLPAAPGQRLLVVNLGNVQPEAVAEIVAAYRRQILRPDVTDRAEIDSWRLKVLDLALGAAKLLPGISKAYAGGP